MSGKTLADTVMGSVLVHPANFFRAGRTNSWNVTVADTGLPVHNKHDYTMGYVYRDYGALPGRANTSLVRPLL